MNNSIVSAVFELLDLRQEIEYLRSLVGEGGGGGMDQSNMAELQLLREKLMESEKLMNEASRSWQEKLARTEARKKEEMEELKVTKQCQVYNLYMCFCAHQ